MTRARAPARRVGPGHGPSRYHKLTVTGGPPDDRFSVGTANRTAIGPLACARVTAVPLPTTAACGLALWPRDGRLAVTRPW